MLIPADLVAQRRYLKGARQTHSNTSLGIGPAILRGLRDLGFRDTAAAVCALVDNAIDAHALTIDVLIDTTAGQVTSIAVIDHGIGMVPEMIRAACAVGASCRLGDGPHLARSGFGLPAAPFAVGSRFDIFSKPAGAPLACATVDLAALTDDAAEIPGDAAASLPTFVGRHLARLTPKWSQGTIIVLSDLDRVAPRAPLALRQALRERLGYVFQARMGRVGLMVDGVPVQPADPLFLTPGGVGFDADGERATVGPEYRVALDDGVMTLRTAILPPAFTALDKSRAGVGRNANSREALVRESQGLIVSRLGRRLDVLPDTALITFGAADRALKAELDFTPELDDAFAPALSLQQVQVTGRVWSALRATGVDREFERLRRHIRQQRQLRRVTPPSEPYVRRQTGGAIAAQKEVHHG